MKKYILSLILISTATFAQDAKDYSKLNSNQLKDTIYKKNEIIKKLNSTISQYKKKQDELLNKNDDSKVVENLKKIINDNNESWLKDLFDKKYSNDTYITETDLESEDISLKIKKSNAYINSIKSVETNYEIIDKCNQALDFNSNYKILYTIQNTVLNEKYNEKNVNEAISNIEKLPKLKADSKLDNRKTRILNALKNYFDSTCSLKKKLDVLKNAECKSPPMQKIFAAYENDDSYKEYFYLVKVITKMKKNKIDYTNDDLQPCEDIKKPTTEAVKLEAVKESTPKKVEETKAGINK